MSKEELITEKNLLKAEKFFKKGNFLLAKREFLKLTNCESDTGITEKIQICDEKIKLEQADDLIKRGRKHLKKRNIQKALECFEKAGQLKKEDWVDDRIKLLKKEIEGDTSLEEAKKSEAKKEYSLAAELYAKACEEQNNKSMLIKKAVCLIKSGKYEEGLAEISSLTVTGDEGLYHHGFALAKTERYFDALMVWEGIDSFDDSFLRQKRDVLNLFRNEAAKIVTNENHVLTVFNHSSQLKKIYNDKWLGELIKHTRFRAVARLWSEGAYEKIPEICFPLPHGDNPPLLEFYARLFFNNAECAGSHYKEAISFLLTSIFRDSLCSDNNEDKVKVRQILLKKLERLVQEKCGDPAIIKHLQIEKNAVQTFRTLADEVPELGSKIITPHAARLLSLSESTLALLKKNRPSFRNQEDFLVLGSYFSSAGESMYLINKGEYKKAIQSLPDNSNNEFSQYCRQRASFCYGLAKLKTNGKNLSRYFNTALPLIKSFKKYEQELIDLSFLACNLDEYDSFENIFKIIYRDHKSEGVSKALSLAISNKADQMLRKESVKAKSAEAMYKNAISIFPANEHAKEKLKSIDEVYELEKLEDAFSRRNLSKGANVAERTNNEEVRRRFFLYISFNIESIEDSDYPDEEIVDLYKKLLDKCLRVDENHPVVQKLREELNELEGNYEPF